MRFIFEIDVNVLVAQLDPSETDLLESLVIRWIAVIQLSDFQV